MNQFQMVTVPLNKASTIVPVPMTRTFENIEMESKNRKQK